MHISVIITCFNLEAYIGQAIQSVLKQNTGNYELEIIVVDDASEDLSPTIISRFPECKLIRNPSNLGVLLSTLEGVKASKGDVVCFLDGDDVWRETKLQLVAKRFNDNPELCFLSHDYDYIDAAGSPLNKLDFSQQKLRGLQEQHVVSEYMRQGILEYRGCVWLGSAYVVRRNAIDWAAFSDWVDTLPEPKMTYQDWLIAFWIATNSSTVLGYIPEKLMSYRIHGLNYSGDASSIDKMLRNLRKGLNTTTAASEIVNKHQYEIAHPKILASQIKEYEYLIALYQDEWLRAIRFLPHLIQYRWSPLKSLKESIRLTSIAIVGSQLFLKFSKFRVRFTTKA